MGETVSAAVKTVRWSEPQRDFIVAIRTSSASGDNAWMDYTKARSWDLLLSYYDEPPGTLPPADMVTVGGLSKFPAIWQVNDAHAGFLADYRAAMFLDNDIELHFEDLDRLFAIFSDFKLALAQASLSPHSHFSWPITVHSPSFRLRYTNFVEIMAPIFSAAALAVCLPTFRQSTSGWGLDLIWPALLGNPRDAIAIIDEVQMTHTKPVDPRNGRFYKYLQSLGVDADEEAKVLARAHGTLRDYATEQYGGVPASPGFTIPSRT